MPVLITPLERVAEVVAQRTAQLLSARVWVVDDRGAVLASYGPGTADAPINRAEDAAEVAGLRVPIRVDGATGVAVVAESTTEDAISPRLARELVELVVEQAAAGARLPDQHELQNKLVHDLLHGLISDEEDVVRQGRTLRLDFTRPRAVILIDAAEYILAWGSPERHGSESQVRRRAQSVINSVVRFFNLPSATICAYIGDGEVAVLKATSTQDLAPWTDREDRTDQLNPSWSNLEALKRASAALLTRIRSEASADITIGIGRHHPGIRGLPRSYEDARVALSLGRRFQGPGGVHCLDALGVAAFVGISDERTKVDLATHLLSPLDQQPDLLATLEVFFRENCCPSATSGRLAIHRNTLSYRLDKIASLTGLDPRRFDDAVQGRLALLLRSVQNDRAG